MRFILLFLIGILLLEGCGYSVRMVSLDDEDRKEQQNKKAMEEQIARLQAETRLLRKSAEEGRQSIFDLQKRRADVDVRLDETRLALQMIQGKIEEEGHRYGELSHQMDDNTFRLNDLGQIKNRLNEEDKKLESIQKTLQGQIDGAKGVTGGLQKSLDSIGARISTLDDQEKRLRDLSALVSEFTQKIPSLLNTQSAQLDELGRQFQKLSQGRDVEQLNQGLLDLSRGLDLLGQKIASKVDEQDRILSKTTKRLEALESKLAPKGKRSARFPNVGEEAPAPSERYDFEPARLISNDLQIVPQE